MSFLRNVVRDLVEKRLWPIAIGLVVALVAVPAVLGGGSDGAASSDSEVAAATTVGPAAAATKVVSLDQQVPDGPVDRAGKVHNPFRQQHVPKDTTGTTPAGAAGVVSAVNDLVNGVTGGSSPSTGGSAPSGGGGGTPTPTQNTTTQPKTEPKKADPKDLYRVTLRFGEVGDLKTRKDVARLTPLPSSSDPFVVFLGVKNDGQTAVFLISTDAVPSGDGKCRPSTRDCETLELKAGDTELFDLQTGTAGVVQYRLDLKSIDVATAASAARAARVHARESKAGREWLRLTVATDPTLLDGWDYSRRLGVLVERTPDEQAADVAHLPTDVAQAAEGTPAP